MESHKEKFFCLFERFLLGVVLVVTFTVSSVQGGAPQIRETCQGPDGRQIPTLYDSNLPVFAEARILPPGERKQAESMGASPYVIVINPEIYYIGRYTQIWLYLRQCAHIQKGHRIVSEGPRELNIYDEHQADCLAVKAMQSDPEISLSSQQINAIERDIERLIRKKRWDNVLAGPQRRIFLRDCASSK